MANKKITDVDVVSTINDADYLFVNQGQSIKQIKKSDIPKPTYTAEEVGALPYTTKIPSKTSDLQNDSGFLTEHQDLSNYALKSEIPKTAADVGAEASGTAEIKVSVHNTATDSHNDIRELISGLTQRLNALADSDDTTLDQMSEVVAYIKSNKSLIDAITTSKINVSDIIDNLTTNVSNKPLSAAQGVALKALIDGITIPEKLPNPQKLTFAGAVTAEYDGSGAVTVEIPAGGVDSYTLPIASPTTLGGVQPVAKTDEMTQEVGVDADGLLFTAPGLGGGSSGGWELVKSVTIEEDVTQINFSFPSPLKCREIVTVCNVVCKETSGTSTMMMQFNNLSNGKYGSNTNNAMLSAKTKMFWAYINLDTKHFYLAQTDGSWYQTSYIGGGMNSSFPNIEEITSYSFGPENAKFTFGVGTVLKMFGR